jgi:homer protein
MFFSSNNAKKWQEELEILRNNNAKLTTALQESHANVEEWKRQLQFYRDECTRLRQLVNKKILFKVLRRVEFHVFKRSLF